MMERSLLTLTENFSLIERKFNLCQICVSTQNGKNWKQHPIFIPLSCREPLSSDKVEKES